jgi:transcriptional regulator|tara:strand:- start:535 stop:732 length:198 start_codon:yes stop_codon:yes gene_type:complete
MKNDIINALEKQYEANIEKANATIKIYLQNSVGIGEHPNIIDEIDKQVDIVSSNEHKIDIIRSFK